MEKVKTFILLVGLLILVSCSNKIPDIENFHDQLNSSITESLLTDFFKFPDTDTKDNLVPAYEELFILIKKFKALGPYDVLKYNKARKNWVGVSEFISDNKLSKTYVVKYSNNEYLYIRFSNDKIQSMFPVKKDGEIVGWL